MNDASDCLILFVRNPVLGKVKTRLAASIGDDRALEIYKLLLKHTRTITEDLNCTKYVWYADEIAEHDLWSGGSFIRKSQHGDDLGGRMLHAFQTAFDNGFQRVVIIGSDCYELDSETIISAFDYLADNDGVIGPALDGGYYLLGLRKLVPEIFAGKAWSTDTVFAETVKNMTDKQMSYKVLQALRDIDDVEDLKRSNL